MKRVIGIDLGTTNVCVVNLEDNKLTVIPTAIAFTKHERYYVGEQIIAKNQIENSNKVVIGFLRLLNLPLNDPKLDVFIEWLPYQITVDDEQLILQLGDANSDSALRISLEEVITDFLRGLAVSLGIRSQVVISTPACFGENQRLFIYNAAEKSGINVQLLCDAPTAIASFYASKRQYNDKLVAFCDFGGGKFEVAIVYFGPSGTFQIIAMAGDPLVGGLEFDVQIANWIWNHLVTTYPNRNWKDFLQVRARILIEAKTLKHLLSTKAEVKIQLPFLAQEDNGAILHFPKTQSLTLSREILTTLTQDLLERVEAICREVIAIGLVNRYEIDDVVLLGDQAIMPDFRKLISQVFGKMPSIPSNAKHLIAYGAALQVQQDDDSQLTYTSLSTCYGSEISDVLQQLKRSNWAAAVKLITKYHQFLPCLAQHGQDFLAFTQFIQRASLVHILDTDPDYLIRIYEHGAQVMKTLTPDLRRDIIAQFYETRKEFLQIPSTDLEMVISAATRSSVNEVLTVYREYGMQGLEENYLVSKEADELP